MYAPVIYSVKINACVQTNGNKAIICIFIFKTRL